MTMLTMGASLYGSETVVAEWNIYELYFKLPQDL